MPIFRSFVSVFLLTFVISGLISQGVSIAGDLLGSLTKPIEGRPRRASSGFFDPESNRDSFHIHAGQRFIAAELEGPGEIRHLWFTIMSKDRRYPRNLMLKIYYDHSDTPSVETPIGDFFAAGNGMMANTSSIPIEVTSYGRGLNSYWRMPFKKHCKIELHNQSTERMSVYFQADWLQKESLPDDVRYFHARYRQEYPAKPFSWYTVFEGKGEGHYVGTVFSTQSVLSSWEGEADDRFYVDGEEVPSIVGSGLEDYFNDAWNLRLTSNKHVGTTIAETKGDERRLTCYRWHIDDPVPFKKSLKLELERRSHVSARDPKTGKRLRRDFRYRPDYWSSVAFWYQKGIAEPLWEIPPAKDRVLHEVWIEPAWIIGKEKDSRGRFRIQVDTSEGLRPIQGANRVCNLKKYFYMYNDEVGAWVDFPFTIAERGRYSSSVLVNLFKHHGIWQVSILDEDDKEIILHKGLDMIDYRRSVDENWPENFHHGTRIEVKLGSKILVPGKYRMRYTCVGSNPLSVDSKTGEFGKGMAIGLDAMVLRKMPVEDTYKWLKQYLVDEKARLGNYEEIAAKVIKKLSDAVTAYHRDHGKYPDTLEQLVGTPYWSEDRIPLDPWKQRYGYRPQGVVLPWAFDLWSVCGLGQDPERWVANWTRPLRTANETDNIVIEGERLDLAQASEGVSAKDHRMQAKGHAPASRRRTLLVKLQKEGDWAEFELPKSVPNGKYKAYFVCPTAWDHGISQWSLAGTPIGEPFDAYTKRIEVHALPNHPTVELTDDSRTLRVVSTGGKSEYGTAAYAGLDVIILEPAE